MDLKAWKKNILSIIVIVIGGFLLFNIEFILTAFITNATIFLMGPKWNGVSNIAGRMISVFVIVLTSWIVLRSRFGDIIKATFLTMPIITILVMIGIGLYGQSKFVVSGIDALIIIGFLFYLHKKKLSWLYYFSTLYVATLGVFILLSGMDI